MSVTRALLQENVIQVICVWKATVSLEKEFKELSSFVGLIKTYTNKSGIKSNQY